MQFETKRTMGMGKWLLHGILMAGSICFAAQDSIVIDPLLKDTDGDGFQDGFDVWIDGKIYIGEARNTVAGNLMLHSTTTPGWMFSHWLLIDSDPRDPRDPSSTPFESPGGWPDRDGDGLSDVIEDANGNGIWDPELHETNFMDADSDDDGLNDGFETTAYYQPDQLPFSGMGRLDPLNPDSDGDGLPDGLEAGITSPADRLRYGLKYIGSPPIGDTDLDATFEFVRQTPNGPVVELRKCFIPDQDPSSITSPTELDTNYDGIPDGEQDPNYNGRRDEGETDAGGGFVSCRYPSVPDNPLYGPYGRPYTVNYQTGNAGPIRISRGERSHIFLYQPPGGEDIAETQFHIGEPEALKVASMKPLAEGSTFYWIELEWLAPSKGVFEFWVESPRLHGGRTPLMKIRTVGLVK